MNKKVKEVKEVKNMTDAEVFRAYAYCLDEKTRCSKCPLINNSVDCSVKELRDRVKDIVINEQIFGRPFKKILFVEDGSIDLGNVEQVLADSNPDIYIIPYRQGSVKPELVDISEE